MIQSAPSAEPPTAPSPPDPREASDNLRARRLYLTRRRREVLAPVEALRDLVDLLRAEEVVAACGVVAGDLATVRDAVDALVPMLTRALDPALAGSDDGMSTLNHDARNLLAIVIGYAQRLRRKAPDAFLPEFEQALSLGKRSLGLVDSTVARLRSPDGVNAADDANSYLDRGDLSGEADDCDDAPSEHPGLILVAEDHDLIRGLLCEGLGRLGHEVVAVRDGFEAIATIRSRPFDLVITDIEMPRVDGFAFLDYLKHDEALRDLPVIVVSGQVDLDSICRCIKAGADDYLPKPYNRLILKTRVDACLGKKRLRDKHRDLLHSVLPAPIVAELLKTGDVRSRRRDPVAVLFADIVGFTPYCTRYQDQPEVIVKHLRRAFVAWEAIAKGSGVFKIKTIGDAFMAAGGLFFEDDRAAPEAEASVLACVECGLAMIEATKGLTDDDGASVGWDLRVGIHVGPVVTGVLGRQSSMLDLWGDTVNIASRLESHGKPGHVNLSVEAWEPIRGRVRGETRTLRKLKGTESEREVFHLEPGIAEVLAPLGPDPAV